MIYNNKTKVLFLSYNGLLEPLLYSQGIIYLRELSRELNIQIVILSFEKFGFFINSKERQRIENLRKELLRDNILWYWLRYHKFPPVLSSIYDILMGTSASAGLILKKKIKFIHARSYVPATIAFVLNKILKMDYIFDMRGFMIDDYAALGTILKNGLIYRIAKSLERSIFKNASYTIMLTYEARKVVFGFIKTQLNNPENIEIIPCCVDTRRFHGFVNKDPILLEKLGLKNKFVFIYAGSLGKLYQPEKMFEFFRIAHNFISESYFLILTPDIQEFELERLKYKNDVLFQNIKCLKIDPTEIGAYISLGDVGIAFYLPSPSRIGNSPTKIGEYLACGIPFLVNRGVGDTEEWVRKYRIGAILNDFNSEYYNEAMNTISSLINDKDNTSIRCRKAAVELVSLEIAKRKYSKIYRYLISNNNKEQLNNL